MYRIKLSNIISKSNEVSELLSILSRQFNSDVCVKDERGKILFGKDDERLSFQYPLLLENEIFGNVKGDENAKPIADFLNLFLAKEAEKKKLGTEVLNLYQELNFIFNFSEKLAQLIDPVVIAQTALNEARHLITSTAGIVVLFDESTLNLNVLASSGDILIRDENINAESLL